MSDNTCAICKKDSYQAALYHDPANLQEGFLCWRCYHERAVLAGAVVFGNGEVGKNAGWTYQYTFAKAIETALYEIEQENNIDMGISIDAHINGSYTASAIVRNHQLYIRIADFHGLQDMGHDDRIKYIDSIVKQLTFELLRNTDNEQAS